MKLSVVIVNWNTVTFLKPCIESLLNSKIASETEVIVVDNHSKDGSAEMVKSDFPGVLLLAENHNHGYARGNNLGIAKATGEYILTLNSDTVLGPDVLPDAISALESRPGYGALGVQQIGTDGKTQASVRGFPTLSGVFGDLSGLAKVIRSFDSYRLNHFDYNRSQDAPQPMGTFLLFRRDALNTVNTSKSEELHPFDEQFPIFFNEVDLLKRLEAEGWNCWYESSVKIKHFGGESTKQVRRSMIWESHLSLIRYFRKHLRGLARISLPFVSGLIWLGALVRAKGIDRGFRP
jgi:GT2 family glycosyltransferase